MFTAYRKVIPQQPNSGKERKKEGKRRREKESRKGGTWRREEEGVHTKRREKDRGKRRKRGESYGDFKEIIECNTDVHLSG